MKKLRERKGSATVILIAVLAVILIVIGLYIRLNWRTFKAEASFGFAIAMLIVALIPIMYLLIRHSIKKARKEKELEKEKARIEKEQAKLEGKSGKAQKKEEKQGD